MSKYDKIKRLSGEEFRRLTGVKGQTFNEMVSILKSHETQKEEGDPIFCALKIGC